MCALELDRNKSFFFCSWARCFLLPSEARPPKEEETFSAYPYSEWLFSSGQDLPRADEFIGKGSYRCNLRMTWRVFFLNIFSVKGYGGVMAAATC